MVRLRVRIVGGSLAGLFVATLLKREGHDVRIYERSVRGLDGRGAGLLGKKETFAILRAAGCEHVARVSVIARERLTFDETGAVVDRGMAPQSQLSWDYLYRTFRDFIAGDDYMLGRHVDGFGRTMTPRTLRSKTVGKSLLMSLSGLTAQPPLCGMP
jgi:2-polyprenyl-6-methoxyphenol hydroxylase-like FAD-dependent oxidoreductase